MMSQHTTMKTQCSQNLKIRKQKHRTAEGKRNNDIPFHLKTAFLSHPDGLQRRQPQPKEVNSDCDPPCPALMKAKPMIPEYAFHGWGTQGSHPWNHETEAPHTQAHPKRTCWSELRTSEPLILPGWHHALFIWRLCKYSFLCLKSYSTCLSPTWTSFAWLNPIYFVTM